MAHTPPPKKPAYPKNTMPQRRKAPQRPVYTYGADVPRQPRKPAGGRIVFDYEESAADAWDADARPQTVRTAPLEHPAPERRKAPEMHAMPVDTQENLWQNWEEEPEAEEPRRVQEQGQPARHRQPEQHEPPAKKKRKKARRNQKHREKQLTAGEARRRRLRHGIVAGTVAAVLLVIGIVVSAAMLFKIETVTAVSSAEGKALVYTEEQIIAAFNHPAGENLFGFSAKDEQERLAAELPYLENVTVRRKLPDQIVITASPAKESCVVESAAGWVVLSENYKILRMEAEPPLELLRIDGVQAEAPVTGKPVVFGEPDKLEAAKEILRLAKERELGPIRQLDLGNMMEISFLYQDRIRVVLGTSNDLDYKIKWTWKMVTPGETENSLGEDEKGTLDVSSRGSDGLGRARWRAGVL